MNKSHTKIVQGINITLYMYLFLGSEITVDGNCSHEIRRQLLLGSKAVRNLDSVLKSKDITLLTNIHIVKAGIFPVVMYRYESWAIKKAESRRIDAYKLWHWRRLLRVPWVSSKEIKPVNLKWNQPWILIGRTDFKVEAPIPWPTDANSRLIGKDLDTGKDWRQKKRVTEDGMVGWHH